MIAETLRFRPVPRQQLEAKLPQYQAELKFIQAKKPLVERELERLNSRELELKAMLGGLNRGNRR